MNRISRLDAFEAGFRFMTWVFSNGEAFGDDVRTFASNLNLDWAGFETFRSEEGGPMTLVSRIEQATKGCGQHVFAWFEVGRNLIFLSNLAGTGAPPARLVDSAISGYRGYLEDARIRVEDRDRIEGVLRGLADDSMERKASGLYRLREMLRDQALNQDEREGEQRRSQIMQNYVTLNLGPGASFTGPLAVGQTISQTYNAAARVDEPDLRQKLETVVVEVGKLIELLDSDENKTDVSEQLATFVEQAKKEKPSKRLLELTADGMLDAAKTIAAMMDPVSTAVKAVLNLVLPGGTGVGLGS